VGSPNAFVIADTLAVNARVEAVFFPTQVFYLSA
jgi:hypothetical protein